MSEQSTTRDPVADASGEAFNNTFHKCRAEISRDQWDRVWHKAVAWARANPQTPDWKGYALLGTGCYAINHTPGPMDPDLGAELIISIATEADKTGNRQVGEERDTDPNAGPIMPAQMAVRIGFLSAAALDALEDQLRHLRRENFPETIGRTQEAAHG